MSKIGHIEVDPREETRDLRAHVVILEEALTHAIRRNHGYSPRACDGCAKGGIAIQDSAAKRQARSDEH